MLQRRTKIESEGHRSLWISISWGKKETKNEPKIESKTRIKETDKSKGNRKRIALPFLFCFLCRRRQMSLLALSFDSMGSLSLAVPFFFFFVCHLFDWQFLKRNEAIRLSKFRKDSLSLSKLMRELRDERPLKVDYCRHIVVIRIIPYSLICPDEADRFLYLIYYTVYIFCFCFFYFERYTKETYSYLRYVWTAVCYARKRTSFQNSVQWQIAAPFLLIFNRWRIRTSLFCCWSHYLFQSTERPVWAISFV